jgi:hypothetical protein
MQMMYHPDKNRSPQGEEIFIKIRTMYDTLNSDVTRKVYDRFGPIEELDCTSCVTFKDYMVNSVVSFILFYVGFGIVLILTNSIGSQFGTFWRFYGFAYMFYLEAVTLYASEETVNSLLVIKLFKLFIPYGTYHDYITILHQLFVNFLLAMNHIVPLLVTKTETLKDLFIAVDAIDNTVGQLHRILKSSVVASMNPFVSDSSTVKEILLSKMKKIAVDRKLFQMDEEYRDLFLAASNAKKTN